MGRIRFLMFMMQNPNRLPFWKISPVIIRTFKNQLKETGIFRMKNGFNRSQFDADSRISYAHIPTIFNFMNLKSLVLILITLMACPQNNIGSFSCFAVSFPELIPRWSPRPIRRIFGLSRNMTWPGHELRTSNIFIWSPVWWIFHQRVHRPVSMNLSFISNATRWGTIKIMPQNIPVCDFSGTRMIP